RGFQRVAARYARATYDFLTADVGYGTTGGHWRAAATLLRLLLGGQTLRVRHGAGAAHEAADVRVGHGCPEALAYLGLDVAQRLDLGGYVVVHEDGVVAELCLDGTGDLSDGRGHDGVLERCDHLTAPEAAKVASARRGGVGAVLGGQLSEAGPRVDVSHDGRGQLLVVDEDVSSAERLGTRVARPVGHVLHTDLLGRRLNLCADGVEHLGDQVRLTYERHQLLLVREPGARQRLAVVLVVGERAPDALQRGVDRRLVGQQLAPLSLSKEDDLTLALLEVAGQKAAELVGHLGRVRDALTGEVAADGDIEPPLDVAETFDVAPDLDEDGIGSARGRNDLRGVLSGRLALRCGDRKQ